MPRYDLFHDTVRTALTKDGWTITHDPFLIEYKGFRLQADLGAAKVFAAEKEAQRIVVEVKVFGTPSFVSELQKSVGQYLMYRTFLKHTAPERELFLALPQSVFEDFFQQEAITEIVEEHQLHLLVFDPTTEEVIKWIK
ncbi:MAG: XisH family protein [Anaerolineales bacterium]|nr:XisH family protein [Anaerolineales bacterium]MCB9127453.1 XisH family protein [Ardenticatenales bacterium]MCB9172214.1 XisH family protein [Ardenticatenales bacterium]